LADLKDLANVFIKAIRAAESNATLNKIKDAIIPQIQTRTRLGKGVTKPEGNTTNLKRLERKTKINRQGLKRKGQLTGPGAQPAKSGLNRSGQMLNSLKGKVSTSNIEITLDREGERKAVAVQKIDPNGFTFMNLSKGETKQVTDIIDDAVNDILKKL